MPQRLTTALAMVFLAIAFPGISPVASADSKQNRQTVVVGVENFAHRPIYWIDETGQYKGLMRDILDAYADWAGLQLEYRIFSTPELFDAFLDGKIHLKTPDNHAWQAERRQAVDISYSLPFIQMIDGVMVLSKNHGRNPAFLRRLGVIRGFTPVPFVKAIDAGRIEAIAVEDFEALFELLRGEKVDGIYASTSMARFYQFNLDKRLHAGLRPLDLGFDASLPHTGSSFHIASTTHPQLIQSFDRFLEQKRPLILSLFNRWDLPVSMHNNTRKGS